MVPWVLTQDAGESGGHARLPAALLSLRRVLLLAVMISCMSASLAHGGIVKFEEVEKRRQAALAEVEPYRAAILAEAPGLLSPLLGDQETTDVPVCTADRSASTYALLIAPDDFGFGETMAGPVNDVELMTAMLHKLGVGPANVQAVVGSRASRTNVKSAMETVLSALGCNDRAVLHYSGVTQSQDIVFDAVVRLYSKSIGKTGLLEISKLRAELDRLVEDADPAFYNLLAGKTADIAFWLNHEQTDASEFILGRDISDFVVLARNRGAHVTVVIDANDAQSLALSERQTAAGDESSWTFAYTPQEERPDDGQLRLLPGHGQYAAFYASASGEGTPEGRFPEGDSNAKSYGLFTFTIVSALGRSVATTPRAIASALNDAYSAGQSPGSPRIEASNPDFALLGEVQQPQHDPIRITAPESVRGATALDRQEITVQGVVDWPAPILGVIVGDKPAALESGGRFKQTLQLKEGLNVLNVIAVTADSRMHQKRVELVFKGDRQALEGKGRRYAVIIANQTYGGATGMTNLATPFADADALATILTEKYGFELELGIGGAIQPLMLKDPTKRQIEVALHQVGKVARLNDTVLVFYAGHGVFEPITSNAYWVPADAEQGFEPSYLSAADISAAIQRIQANHVILISDSCYSGALLRGGNVEDFAIAGDQRMQALLKMQSRKSRIVITSGNNEPVADLGGAGHSVFARALLTGLEKMDHEAFSARELFDGYILQQVTANADQEPQYRPLEKVGHEGGDFIFVKSSSASARAAN